MNIGVYVDKHIGLGTQIGTLDFKIIGALHNNLQKLLLKK